MSQGVPADEAAKRRRAEIRAKLTRHEGMATIGDRLVPLEEFRRAATECGERLSPESRAEAVARFLTGKAADAPVEGPYERIAVFGGIYNNRYALEALVDDALERGAEALYCLGDFGGFGPNPDAVWPLLDTHGVLSIQGNYEASLASGREDCDCGYADPRDNHFAAISYRYTAEHCSPDFKAYMGALPERRRVRVGERELLLVHGSPRRVNEFLFESTAPPAYLEALCDENGCDGILCTHSGLQWHRHLPSGRDVVNVGVIGRPANDGNRNVWYAMLSGAGHDLAVELIPLAYDHQALAAEMRREGLPSEFIETITTGWWTTCLEVLPARERARSRY